MIQDHLGHLDLPMQVTRPPHCNIQFLVVSMYDFYPKDKGVFPRDNMLCLINRTLRLVKRL